LRASGANLGIYQPFAPETVTEYEVGLKATLLQQRLRTNVALFYDDYTNVQRNVLTIVGGAPLTLVTNATKSRLKGGEGEATWRVSEELALSAGVGYLDAKYLSFVDLTGDRTGEPWPAPQWNYSLGARFAKPTDFGSVSLDVNWAWQDDLSLTPNAVAQGQVLQKAYGLLNGRVTLAFEDHDAEIALFGRNLLNEKFYISSIGFEAAGFNVLHTGEPRIYGVQFTKRFGQID
jgi:iron complex outermembrane receptor protein